MSAAYSSQLPGVSGGSPIPGHNARGGTVTKRYRSARASKIG